MSRVTTHIFMYFGYILVCTGIKIFFIINTSKYDAAALPDR